MHPSRSQSVTLYENGSMTEATFFLGRYTVHAVIVEHNNFFIALLDASLCPKNNLHLSDCGQPFFTLFLILKIKAYMGNKSMHAL